MCVCACVAVNEARLDYDYEALGHTTSTTRASDILVILVDILVL